MANTNPSENYSSSRNAKADGYSSKPVAQCPKNHLAKAIIVTIMCCMPFGIPAIVYAAGVESAFIEGNIALATERSNNANKWSNISLISGLVFIVLYIIFVVILVVAGYKDFLPFHHLF